MDRRHCLLAAATLLGFAVLSQGRTQAAGTPKIPEPKVLTSACPPICDPNRARPKPPPPLPEPTGVPSGPQGDTWQSLAKLPDFSGAWVYDPYPNQLSDKEIIPLLPPYQKKLDEQREISKTGGDVPAYAYHCMPRGVPEIMQVVTRAYEFVMTPGLIAIIPQNNELRFVYMDGRKMPADWKKSYNGFSTGHWEGDMLVVDTVGIRPHTDMFYGFPGGTQQHVVERFKRISHDQLQNDTTVDDPTALSAPYTFGRTYSLSPIPITDESCLQNNRDLGPDGKQRFDLTPPPGLNWPPKK
jgi:hypothetical protein